MKQIYCICACFAIVLSSNAQPVLTQSNNAPVIGDNFVYSRISWDGVAPTQGANQTWDYSGITEITTVSLENVDPATCPSPSSFPSATVGCDWGGGAQYEYLNVNSSYIDRVGFYASSVEIPYQNGEKTLEFPFTYNDTYVDPFASTFTNGVVWDRAGDVTVTAVGYGTLILPNSTITNVLLVKLSEDYGDSYLGTEMYHYNTDIYQFYKPGFHTPVLALTHYVQGSTTTNYGNFIDDPTLSDTEPESADQVSVFPNPVTDLLQINYGTQKSQISSVEIVDITGKTIMSFDNAPDNIETSTLPSGIYFVNIWINENKQVIKLAKQ